MGSMFSCCKCFEQLNTMNDNKLIFYENPRLMHILSKNHELKLSPIEPKNQLLENDFLANEMDDDIDFCQMEELNTIDETNPNALDSIFPQEDERTWFLPHCSRENAEKLLKGRKDGTFLVRDSIKLKGKYILSVVIRGHIKHMVINKTDEGYSLYGDKIHPTLMSLVMFYAISFDQPLNLPSSSRTNLNFPIFQ